MTTTTYTIDAYLSTQSNDSDPDPYFEMTTRDCTELESSLFAMIRDDFADVTDVVLNVRPNDEPHVTAYDIVAIRTNRHDDVIGVAYVETTH